MKILIIIWLLCGLFVDSVPASPAGATAWERVQNFWWRLLGPIGVIKTIYSRITKKK